MSAAANASPTSSTSPDATARLLRAINARRRKRSWAWWVLGLTVALTLGFGALAWLYPGQFPGLIPATQVGVFRLLVAGIGAVVLVAGLVIARQLARAQWAPKAAFVAYKMDETAYRLYLGLQYELESLSHVAGAWVVNEVPQLDGTTASWRTRVRVRPAPLSDVKVQLPVRGVALPWISLFFLPTQILILQHGRYQSIGYSTLTAGAVHEPSAQEWPERGRLTIKVGKAVLFDLEVAGFDLAHEVVAALLRYREYLAAPKPPEPAPAPPPPPRERETYRQYSRADQHRQMPPPPPPPRQPPPVPVAAPNPYAVLGLREGATRKEITAAYRVMAKLYHPDHTHTLGADIRAAAELKMKEINAAYAELKQ